MFILLCMLSLALAEPPVGHSYFEADQTGYDQTPPDHTVSFARSSTSFNGLSNQYLPPSSRSTSQEYGPPKSQDGLSQKYGLPLPDTSKLRSGISQEYGTPIARSSQHSSLNSDLNQSFSSANLKTGVSQRYSAPSSMSYPSNFYESPSLRSSPSTEYGVPQLRSSNVYTQQALPVHNNIFSFRDTKSHSRSVVQEYGTPMTSEGFSFRSQSSGNPSQTSGMPARSLLSQYSTPSPKSTATGFGVPTGPLESSYRIPFGRNQDQDLRTYGTPNFGRSNSKNNAISSSYPSRRTPSMEYGAPSSRSREPAQKYGLPQDSFDDQSYEYARNALEALNQVPANYDFAYKVSDDYTGSDFGHSESRQLDRAEGAYFVLLPDGTKQVVEYEADEDGFKPRISVEQVDSPTALAAEGPY